MDPYASIDDSPLATAYLQDLRDLLRSTDADAAESIVNAVREHIAIRFAQAKVDGPADMAAVLRQSGPVEQIVAKALLSSRPDPFGWVPPSNQDRGVERPWFGFFAAAVLCLVLSPFLVGGFAAVAVLVALVRIRRVEAGTAGRRYDIATALLAVMSMGITVFTLIPMLM